MSTHALVLVQTALLVGISLAIIYPVVAYSRSVLHTEAIVTLAASMLTFTAGALIEEAMGMAVVAEGVYFLSAVSFGGSVWLFAREFVSPGESGFGADDGPEPGAGPRFSDVSESRAEGGFAEASEAEPAATEGFSSAPEDDVSGGFAGATEDGDGE
ncbi:hypothetical protein JCM30237_12620 [Halolamina litorea]|uniref:Uncharacterized protein n=1 Tax=Halolamina litorea TaxID=1515593 RepID=A0ABD6BMF9_9EURY|nr:hypothetical protein [Halolamina litorea]